MKDINVLVVDDDFAMQKLLKAWLSQRNCNVDTFTRAKDALRVLRSRDDIQLVITDIFMPEMDGIEFISTLKREKRDIPVIAMSCGGSMNYTNVTDVAVKLGADAALLKPFAFGQLEAICDSIELSILDQTRKIDEL